MRSTQVVNILFAVVLAAPLSVGVASAQGSPPDTVAFQSELKEFTRAAAAARRSLDAGRTFALLSAVGTVGGKGAAATSFSVLADNANAQTPETVIKAIQTGATLLDAHFALATAIGGVGSQLKLLPDPLAEKIVKTTGTLETVANVAQGILGLAAAATAAGGSDASLSAGLAGGAAALGAPKSNSSGAVNGALAGTLNKAREIADKLSLNAYFSLELSSLVGAIGPVEESMHELASRKVDPNKPDEVLKYAGDFVAGFARVDAFYDGDIPKLERLVEGRIASPIYTQETIAHLGELQTTVQKAGGRWAEARPVYLQWEQDAAGYVVSHQPEPK